MGISTIKIIDFNRHESFCINRDKLSHVVTGTFFIRISIILKSSFRLIQRDEILGGFAQNKDHIGLS